MRAMLAAGWVAVLLAGCFGSHGDLGPNTANGAANGVAVGGGVGQGLDRQADDLRGRLESGEIGIANTGRELVVTLPAVITFETGSADIRASLRGDLVALAENLDVYRETTVDIVGHTDNVGDATSNQRLSAAWAESVAMILLDGGVAPARLRTIGRGESEPKTSNLSAKGRALNRRVEIVIRPSG